MSWLSIIPPVDGEIGKDDRFGGDQAQLKTHSRSHLPICVEPNNEPLEFVLVCFVAAAAESI